MTPSAVLQEIRDLVARCYKEIVLSGIHLGTYGRDLDPRTSLIELLRSALTADRLERIRLSSIEPLEVTPEIIDLVATHPRMAHHFHIPLQSGSASVLRAMFRPYTPEYYADLLRASPRRDSGCLDRRRRHGRFSRRIRRRLSSRPTRLIDDSPLTYLHVFPFLLAPGNGRGRHVESRPRSRGQK